MTIERQPCDGPVGVRRLDDDGLIVVEVTHEGTEQSLVMSEFNARRALAMLSIITGLNLSKAAAKEIKP